MVKQAKRSLKEAIKKHDKGESIRIEEFSIVPNSYYNWGIIIVVGVLVIAGLIGVVWFRKKKRQRGV